MNSKYFVYFPNLLELYYLKRNISYLLSFTCFCYTVFEFIGPNFMIILLSIEWYLLLTYNKSIFTILKKYRDLFFSILKLYTIINILYSGYISNIFEFKLLGLIIIILIFIKVYINIIDKNFEKKYPFLYFFLNSGCDILLVVSVWLVLMYPFGGPMGPPPRPSGSGGGPSGFGGSGGGPSGFGGGPGGYGDFGGGSGGRRRRDRDLVIPRHPTMPDDEREGYIWVTPRDHPLNNMRDIDGHKRPVMGILMPQDSCPTERHEYRFWTNPVGFDRPQTPDMRPPRPLNPIVFSRPAPRSDKFRRHWEGNFVYTNDRPVEGDTFRWIQADLDWVPAAPSTFMFVHRDFHYRNGRWCWRVGTLGYSLRGKSIMYWYE
jgi:hypothetical protein